jgi:hypothetical protein
MALVLWRPHVTCRNWERLVKIQAAKARCSRAAQGSSVRLSLDTVSSSGGGARYSLAGGGRGRGEAPWVALLAQAEGC